MTALSGELNPTIFHEPWWLQSACGSDYKEVTVDGGGKIVGRLPFAQKTYLNFNMIQMPLLARCMGPAIISEGSATARVTREIDITSKLISKLPNANHVHLRLHTGVQHTLAFNAAGFQTGVDFTVRIDPVSPEVLWKQMRDKMRNSIRRAQENLEVVELGDADFFIQLYEKNIDLNGRKLSVKTDIFKTMINEALKRERGRVLALKALDGNVKVAIFTIWDSKTEYYLMSTRSPEAHNGSIPLLLWRAIGHAHALGLSFDMAGVHVKNNALPNLLLTTGFGGIVVPNFYVSKTSAFLRFGLLARNVVSRGIKKQLMAR